MKKYNWLFIVLIFITMSYNIYSQEFKIPSNYKLESNEDYKKYEKDILRCIEYLENSPLSTNDKKRQEANAFLLKWLTGSPNVKITLRSYVMNYFEENKDFILIFMGGWARYTLENNYDTDEFKGSLAGIRSLIKVYNNGKGVKEDSEVEDLIEMEEDDELEEWVKEEIESDKS